MKAARLTGLFVYPLKSGRGLSMSSAMLSATGVEHDREWLIVDERGRFQTQRELPQLATLAVTLPGDQLRLEAPAQPALELDRDFAGETRRVLIWRDLCSAVDAGDAAAHWLRNWLGDDYRLVRFDRREQRLSNRDWTGAIEAPNLFADGFPLLLLSQASLDDLAVRAARRFPVERFRPNLLIDGVDPYAEDFMDELWIGAVRLKIVKACTRCSIITTDQQSGQRDGDEPLRTLRNYRYDAKLKGIVLAQNLVILEGIGETLHVGAECRYSLR